MQGQADRKLQSLTIIVNSVANERFRIKNAEEGYEPPRSIRRQTRIENQIRGKRRYIKNSSLERLEKQRHVRRTSQTVAVLDLAIA
ncbi:hypothetical protein DPMN_174714 [Dreissena polymorpha]|uniref:Uncharacterized protein n=1 Tax=Dreissena polymorpha TaxID=45954 RepID=A0A9D4E7N2_DREPO|nr:hypothetical protein DPMN_174714 [Dreissena polymorpha]